MQTISDIIQIIFEILQMMVCLRSIAEELHRKWSALYRWWSAFITGVCFISQMVAIYCKRLRLIADKNACGTYRQWCSQNSISLDQGKTQDTIFKTTRRDFAFFKTTPRQDMSFSRQDKTVIFSFWKLIPIPFVFSSHLNNIFVLVQFPFRTIWYLFSMNDEYSHLQ